MIQTANDIFVLHTAHTTYAFRKLPTGQLEHLYYGRKIHVCEPLDENAVAPLIEKHTFQPGNSRLWNLSMKMEVFLRILCMNRLPGLREERREMQRMHCQLPMMRKIRWNISV